MNGESARFRPALLAAAAGILASTVIFAWALPRGFDLLDEAFYLMGYARPEDVQLSLTQFHQLVGRFPGARSLSVLGFRVLAFAVALATGAVLGLAAPIAWTGSVSGDRSRRLTVVVFAMLGGLVYFSWGPRSLSYNTLNGLLCAVETGGLFAVVRGAGAPASAGRMGLTGAVVGLALGLHFFVKAPPAMLVAAGVFAAAPFAVAAGGYRRAAFMLGLACGGAAVLAWFFLAVVPLPRWRTDIAALRDATARFYGLEVLWRNSFRPLVGAFARALVAGVPAATLAFAASRARRLARPGLALTLDAVCLGVVLGATLSAEAWRGGMGGTLNAWRAHFYAGCALIGAWLGSPARPTVRQLGILAILGALPFVASAGSGNAIVAQALFHLAPWFVGFGLLLVDVAAYGSVLPTALAVFLGTAVTSQVHGGQVSAPYGIHEPMSDQRVPVPTALPALAGIRIGPLQAGVLSEYAKLLEAGGFQAGDPIWGMYDFPGIVFLAGGRAPVTPWLFRSPDFEPFGCLMLSRAPRQGAREFLLLSREPGPYVRECLARSGRPLEEAVTLGTISKGLEGPVRLVLLPATDEPTHRDQR